MTLLLMIQRILSSALNYEIGINMVLGAPRWLLDGPCGSDAVWTDRTIVLKWM